MFLYSHGQKTSAKETSFTKAKINSQAVKGLNQIADIRNATRVDVINLLCYREHKQTGQPSLGIKMSKDGTFKMHFSYEKKDEYSEILKRSLGNGFYYRRILHGTYTLYEANLKEMGRGVSNQPIKNEYGEELSDFVYTKYYVVFTGTDEQGSEYTFCTRLYQQFDEKYLYRWYLGFTKQVDKCGCKCPSGSGKNRDVWVSGFNLQGDDSED